MIYNAILCNILIKKKTSHGCPARKTASESPAVRCSLKSEDWDQY